MDQPMFKQIAVVGVGLLGGSVGLAAKSIKLCDEVVGVARKQATIEEARRMGAITRGTMNLRKGVGSADLIVLCTPVRHIIATLPDVFAAAKSGAIVTDVGSTKTSIVRAGEEASAKSGANFVGSHPMAGSEKTG